MADNSRRDGAILALRPGDRPWSKTDTAAAAAEMRADGWKDVTAGVVRAVWRRAEAIEAEAARLASMRPPRDRWRKFSLDPRHADLPDEAALIARNALASRP